MKQATIDPGASDGEAHESDEEVRFFSQPPPAYEEHDLASAAPSSLAGTSQATTPVASARLSAQERAALARFAARRAKLQRRVAATLCGAVSLLMVGMVAHGRAESERRLESGTTVMHAAAKSIVTASANVATVPVNDVAAPPSTATAPSPPDVTTLIHTARKLLNTGKSREGVAAAREAFAQAPRDAEPYVLLGAGLQDLGNFSEAREVFNACLKAASHGPVATCRYFAKQ